MAKLRVPSLMRDLTAGQDEVEMGGTTVGELLENLTAAYPGFAARLVADGRLKPGLTILVDDRVAIRGLGERLGSGCRIQIRQAVAGG